MNYSREKSSVCIRSKHCGLPGLPDHADLTKSRNWIFTHVGLSAHAHNNSNNSVQEVEVHGWLLSGSEELFAALI